MAQQQQNSSGGSPTVITGMPTQQRPLNLLDAVSEIQQMCAIEKRMTEEDYMDKNFFTTKQRIDFFAVGARNALLHFLFTLVATPITIAVLHNLIHLFGDRNITLFDEIYALILSFSLSIGFGVFLSTLKECHVGVISKAMINSLFGGLIFGETLKFGLSAAIYAVLYLSITPDNVVAFLKFLNAHFYPLMVKLHANYLAMYYWIMKFRNVFPLATAFIFLSGVFMVGIPAGVIYLGSLKNKRLPEELD